MITAATSDRPVKTPSANGDTAAKERVIEAAVASILELGFYRASTNEIARRAGVTWGVIQHYFGTREALMLAVLQEGAGEFFASVENRHIEGETVVERMEQLTDIFSTTTPGRPTLPTCRYCSTWIVILVPAPRSGRPCSKWLSDRISTSAG